MTKVLVTGGTVFSSSAVYPEYALQPFKEDTPLSVNKHWGKYGTDKIEAFVFDCALGDRKFYLPQNGEMKLHFFHIHDLCRFIDVLLKGKPQQHIFNVGNKEAKSLEEGLDESLKWYVNNVNQVNKKSYMDYIDKNSKLIHKLHERGKCFRCKMN